MHIAFTTTFDAKNVHKWSGTPYYMSHYFNKADIEISYIGNLTKKLPRFFKLKQLLQHQLTGQRESPRFNEHVAKHYSQQVKQRLAQQTVDAIVSPLINPIAYLETEKPIILWTDALYAGLLGFYKPFTHHSMMSQQQGNQITSACLSRCRLAIFSSEWAANTAIHTYGAERDKVKVVPFGANLENPPTFAEVKQFIKQRSFNKIKLLFLAKSWERKGGDTVLAVTRALHEAGYPVELTIVGIHPSQLETLPDYIKCLGYISKENANGRNQIQTLLAEHHFLFVPSKAEAYGIVFCEANAFGVPCLTTYVGGISTIVKNHQNGMTFSLHAPIKEYCDYIINTTQHRQVYEELALNAYQAFSTRLNWESAIREVKILMEKVIS